MDLARLRRGQEESRQRRLVALLVERRLLAAEEASKYLDAPELLLKEKKVTLEQLEAFARELAQRDIQDAFSPALPEGVPDDLSMRVGKYVIVTLLGKGGMGEVWRAWDTDLRRWVALKRMTRGSPELRARFRREALTAGRLNHPHIAAVYEANEDYIAMRCVDGPTLTDLPCRDRRRFVELLRDAALAVHYAHEQGVIHRDLKPENLMVENGHVFVMDFGLAKETAADARFSMPGRTLGTPGFMPPEQARGLEVGPASDVYSLGATLYSVIAGRPPFADSNAYDLLLRTLQTDPPRLRQIDPSIDWDLETIVMKCLEKEPERRYTTARQLAEDLSRWLAGEPIQARPPSVGYRMTKWVRRRRTPVIVGCAGLILAIGVAGGLGPKWLAESRARKAEREAAARREEALRRLGIIWSDAPVIQEWTRQPQRPPEEIARALADLERRSSAFVAEQPGLAEGWCVRARARLLRGDLDGAEADLAESLRLAPGFRPALALFGRVLMDQGLRLRHATRYERDDAWRLRHAEHRLRIRDVLVRLNHTKPGDWGIAPARDEEVNENLVLVTERVLDDDDEGAVRHLKTLPPHEEYCLWLAALTGDWERHLGEAVRLAPHHVRARLDRGAARIARKDPEGALADLEHALRIHPDLDEALNNRGVLRFGRGEREAAVRDFEEAIRRRPKAMYCVNLGNASGRVADYERAMEVDPNYAPAWLHRGLSRHESKDYDGAIADFTHALDLYPEYAEAHFNRGNARREKKDLPGAIADYDRATQLNPGYAEAFLNRGITRSEQGLLGEALEDVSWSLHCDPACVAAWCTRAMLHERRKEWDEAIRDLTEAVQRDRENPHPYFQRGIVKLRKGDFQGAEYDFDWVITLDPKSAMGYHNLGTTRMELGKTKAAAGDFTRAIELDPKMAEAYLSRARAREGLEDVSGAIEDCEAALKILPEGSPYRARAQEDLRRLRRR